MLDEIRVNGQQNLSLTNCDSVELIMCAPDIFGGYAQGVL